jgi:hypothetical protein
VVASALKWKDGFPTEKVSLSSSGFITSGTGRVCKETSALFVNKVNSAHFCIFAFLPTVCPKLKLMFVLISVPLALLRNVTFFQNVCSLVVYFLCLVLRLTQNQQQNAVKTWNLYCVTQDTEFKLQRSLKVVPACFIPSIPTIFFGLILGRWFQNFRISCMIRKERVYVSKKWEVHQH